MLSTRSQAGSHIIVSRGIAVCGHKAGEIMESEASSRQPLLAPEIEESIDFGDEDVRRPGNLSPQ
jgi:hypothetical protein